MAESGAGSNELWKTNGTSQGTMLVNRFANLPNSHPPRKAIASQFTLNTYSNPNFFFSLRYGYSDDTLWQSDGTLGTTREIPSEATSPVSDPAHMHFYGHSLYFSGSERIKGNALWRYSADSDYDGVNDSLDNCGLVFNDDPKNFDEDPLGDKCDTDDDNDGVPDDEDVFPYDATESKDNDKDGLGDNMDPDDDNDGVDDFDIHGMALDNCQFTANTEQEDADGDGIGDACEDDEICFPETRLFRILCQSKITCSISS